MGTIFCTFPLDHAKGLWTLSEHDIECLAIGAGILGCGGGGSPSIGKLLATQAVREGKQIQIKNPFRLVFPGSARAEFSSSIDDFNDLPFRVLLGNLRKE